MQINKWSGVFEYRIYIKKCNYLKKIKNKKMKKSFKAWFRLNFILKLVQMRIVIK